MILVFRVCPDAGFRLRDGMAFARVSRRVARGSTVRGPACAGRFLLPAGSGLV